MGVRARGAVRDHRRRRSGRVPVRLGPRRRRPIGCYLYYGAADTVIGLATATFSEVMARVCALADPGPSPDVGPRGRALTERRPRRDPRTARQPVDTRVYYQTDSRSANAWSHGSHLNATVYAVRRDAFVDVAQRLIQAKGYQQMSIQDVLDELDASRGAFYHYFGSKADLLEAVVERLTEAAMAAPADRRRSGPVGHEEAGRLLHRPRPLEGRADRPAARPHRHLARGRQRDRPREVPPGDRRAAHARSWHGSSPRDGTRAGRRPASRSTSRASSCRSSRAPTRRPPSCTSPAGTTPIPYAEVEPRLAAYWRAMERTSACRLGRSREIDRATLHAWYG